MIDSVRRSAVRQVPVLLVLFAAAILLASCNAVIVIKPEEFGLDTEVYEPPPHAPAHGYRHRHSDGTELVYDSGLDVYVVVGNPRLYFQDSLYIRADRGGWVVSESRKGPWRNAWDNEVPLKLMARVQGPPPHAPAHGYRHKHWDGTELVYDSGLDAYVLMGVRDVYFQNNFYIRVDGGRWEVSDSRKGPWREARGREVPVKLRAKKHGPPPHAPAHGYRYRHRDGTDFVYDSGLGAYVVPGVPGLYFQSNHYIRLNGNIWEVSANRRGPWRGARSREIPVKLKAELVRHRAETWVEEKVKPGEETWVEEKIKAKAEPKVRAKKHGPPPQAPAHGYRHRHRDGTELVYDSGLDAYIVPGVAGLYFQFNSYIRLNGSRWEVSVDRRGPWRDARPREVPVKLRAELSKPAERTWVEAKLKPEARREEKAEPKAETRVEVKAKPAEKAWAEAKVEPEAKVEEKAEAKAKPKVKAKKQGPPPQAPAHGYRHRQSDGTELVFDSGLGAYVVADNSGMYFQNDLYFRLNRGRWEVSADRNGPWRNAAKKEVPPLLRKESIGLGQARKRR